MKLDSLIYERWNEAGLQRAFRVNREERKRVGARDRERVQRTVPFEELSHMKFDRNAFKKEMECK